MSAENNGLNFRSASRAQAVDDIDTAISMKQGMNASSYDTGVQPQAQHHLVFGEEFSAQWILNSLAAGRTVSVAQTGDISNEESSSSLHQLVALNAARAILSFPAEREELMRWLARANNLAELKEITHSWTAETIIDYAHILSLPLFQSSIRCIASEMCPATSEFLTSLLSRLQSLSTQSTPIPLASDESTLTAVVLSRPSESITISHIPFNKSHNISSLFVYLYFPSSSSPTPNSAPSIILFPTISSLVSHLLTLFPAPESSLIDFSDDIHSPPFTGHFFQPTAQTPKPNSASKLTDLHILYSSTHVLFSSHSRIRELEDAEKTREAGFINLKSELEDTRSLSRKMEGRVKESDAEARRCYAKLREAEETIKILYEEKEKHSTHEAPAAAACANDAEASDHELLLQDAREMVELISNQKEALEGRITALEAELASARKSETMFAPEDLATSAEASEDPSAALAQLQDGEANSPSPAGSTYSTAPSQEDIALLNPRGPSRLSDRRSPILHEPSPPSSTLIEVSQDADASSTTQDLSTISEVRLALKNSEDERIILQDRIVELTSQLHSNTHHHDELELTIQSLSSSKSTLQKHLSDLTEDHKSERFRLQTQIDELTKEVERLTAEISSDHSESTRTVDDNLRTIESLKADLVDARESLLRRTTEDSDMIRSLLEERDMMRASTSSPFSSIHQAQAGFRERERGNRSASARILTASPRSHSRMGTLSSYDLHHQHQAHHQHNISIEGASSISSLPSLPSSSVVLVDSVLSSPQPLTATASGSGSGSGSLATSPEEVRRSISRGQHSPHSPPTSEFSHSSKKSTSHRSIPSVSLSESRIRDHPNSPPPPPAISRSPRPSSTMPDLTPHQPSPREAISSKDHAHPLPRVASSSSESPPPPRSHSRPIISSPPPSASASANDVIRPPTRPSTVNPLEPVSPTHSVESGLWKRKGFLGGTRRDTQPWRKDTRSASREEPQSQNQNATPPPPITNNSTLRKASSSSIPPKPPEPQPSPSPKPEPKTYCALCSDTHPSSNIITITGCQHFLCKNCTKTYLRSKLDEGRFPVICPMCQADDLYEHHFIGRDIAVGLIDKAHLEKWDALEVGQVSVEIKCDKCNRSGLVDRQEYLSAQFIHCPLGRLSTSTSTTSPSGSASIESCTNVWCKLCLKPITIIDGMTQDHSCDGSLELEALAKARGWKPCPGCGMMIDRIVGCNHIACQSPGCNTHFCYVCGKMIAQSFLKSDISVKADEHFKSCDKFDALIDAE
ncbi:hypothetical protein SISSUDRAFT_1050080 [Sistotremastrum suecicum HHB10207 ss-3]|uniref:RING-type domain-containing protein n=1 Tax=Sistotremastrum suecicum HHB10207 ss-3 TaxID=1314776 RepID=A0A166BEV2_9AGAM|nr:hypothetical protein SISSUDRAFT_1050080 [Sistotremastrum suecicum HHB10207 ss-3]